MDNRISTRQYSASITAPSASNGRLSPVNRPNLPADFRWKKQQIIGKGTFGVVYRGVVEGKVSVLFLDPVSWFLNNPFPSLKGNTLAVKEINLFDKSQRVDKDSEAYRTKMETVRPEVTLLLNLGNHENIVQCYGALESDE